MKRREARSMNEKDIDASNKGTVTRRNNRMEIKGT